MDGVEPRTYRRALAAAAIGAVLLLTSCAPAPAPEPLTASAAADSLAHVDGLVHTSVTVEDMGDGHDIAVTAFLEDGYKIADPTMFADYLIRLAWSVDGTEPDQGVILTVVAGAGDTFNIADALADGGWIKPREDTDPLVIYLDPAIDGATFGKLGDWPGSAPTIPDGAVAPR